MKRCPLSIFTLACLTALAVLPVYAEPGSSPSPTSTPHVEPSASPSPTPKTEPSASPSATPHEEPSATPHDEPSATPSPTTSPKTEPSPTATPHSEPSASPSATPHEEPEPSATPREDPKPTATPRPSATPGDDDDHDSDDHGGRGEVSLRGLYEGTTSAGALAVFYFDNNKHIQIHVLDIAGQVIGFGEGSVTNGSFSLTLSSGQAIAGTANEQGIAVTLAGVNFQASRVPTFGQDNSIAGRYFGVAHGPSGESHVLFLIDASKHIIMVQRTGTTLTGGFGTVTAPVAPASDYTFVLNNVVGSSSAITGVFNIHDGVFAGSFTTSDGTFTVNSFKSSLANRMANISTRGLVASGQGQLIGGFIITGGPKMVLIRALGPSLAAAGVSPALANPSLQLFAGSTLLASNDDWKTNTNTAQIIASGIAPKDDLESALLIRLEPGAYTTVVSGTGDTPAIGLVEVYEAGSD